MKEIPLPNEILFHHAVIGRNDDETPSVKNNCGFPLTFDEVTEIIEICQAFLASKTPEEMDRDFDEHFKAVLPRMHRSLEEQDQREAARSAKVNSCQE